MNEYSFAELLDTAVKSRNQDDINRLGEWLYTYDSANYNGEHWTYRDNGHEYVLTPVWKETSEDVYEVERYEFEVY